MVVDAVVRLVVNGVDLVANACELAGRPDLRPMQRVDRVTKIALNALAIGSAGATVLGASPSVQRGFAEIELMGNVLTIPLAIFPFVDKTCAHGGCSWKDVGRFTELIGARLLRAIRLWCDIECLQERKYLAMTDQERAEAKRPVFKIEGTGNNAQVVYVGDKPVDKAECELSLKNASNTAHVLGIGELLGERHLFTKLVFSPIFSTASFTQHFQEDYRVNREREDRAEIERREGFPFIERETVPEQFDDDPILSQYICPITQCPIRHPVIEPGTGTMYERAAIEEWVGMHHNSPLTRRPLETDDLAPARDIQAIIDNRLRELQEERSVMEQQIDQYLERRRQEHSSEVGGIPRVADVSVPAQPVVEEVVSEQPRAAAIAVVQPPVGTIVHHRLPPLEVFDGLVRTGAVVAERPALGNINPEQPRAAIAILDQPPSGVVNQERDGEETSNQQIQDRLDVARQRLQYFQGQGFITE